MLEQKLAEDSFCLLQEKLAYNTKQTMYISINFLSLFILIKYTYIRACAHTHTHAHNALWIYEKICTQVYIFSIYFRHNLCEGSLHNNNIVT